MVERGANGRDLAVHHRRRRDNVRARLRMRYGDAPEQRQRRVVVHAIVAEDATVAVLRVGAQAYVRHDDEVGRGHLERSDRLLHHAAGVVRLGAQCILALRHAE